MIGWTLDWYWEWFIYLGILPTPSAIELHLIWNGLLLTIHKDEWKELERGVSYYSCYQLVDN